MPTNEERARKIVDEFLSLCGERGELNHVMDRVSQIANEFLFEGVLSELNELTGSWKCGKCDIEAGLYPGAQPLAGHSRHCPKRVEVDPNNPNGLQVGNEIFVEQAWEDGAGNYHDEYATILSILPDGEIKLKFSRDDVTEFLDKEAIFIAKDYEVLEKDTIAKSFQKDPLMLPAGAEVVRDVTEAPPKPETRQTRMSGMKVRCGHVQETSSGPYYCPQIRPCSVHTDRK